MTTFIEDELMAELAELTGLFAAPDTPDPWQDRAICAQTDPDAFFPEKGGSTREAKKICLDCPVRQECLDYALDHDERFGIWGGFSERERRRLSRGEDVTPSHGQRHQYGPGWRNSGKGTAA